MIVVDVETTGTEPHKHSIVSIGALDLENPTETFYKECRIWDGAHIDPMALNVNGFSEDQVKDQSKPEEGEAVADFFAWLKGRPSKLIAGQNPSFDIGFLRSAAERHHIDFFLPQRSIDLHTVTYLHMIKRNLVPPAKEGKSDIHSDFIMNYVGIPAEPKPHVALNGAIWEAEALSRLFFDKSLLKQFESHPIPWK